jgi:hypothetical protein
MILLRVASSWLDISALLQMLKHHAPALSPLSDPFVAQATGASPLVVRRFMLAAYRVVGALQTV